LISSTSSPRKQTTPTAAIGVRAGVEEVFIRVLAMIALRAKDSRKINHLAVRGVGLWPQRKCAPPEGDAHLGLSSLSS
jgi:hypothetical protein